MSYERFTQVEAGGDTLWFAFGVRSDIGAVTFDVPLYSIDFRQKGFSFELMAQAAWGDITFHGYVPEGPGDFPLFTDCKTLGRPCYPHSRRASIDWFQDLFTVGEEPIYKRLEREMEIWERSHKMEHEE